METNILNPTPAHALNPDYGYEITDEATLLVWRPRSGFRNTRRLQEGGRVYTLGWQNRNLANMLALRQWEKQFEQDFFTYYDIAQGRYFSGYFGAPLTYSETGNARWSMKGTFVEEPGRPMYGVPNNWARDAMFIPERDSLGTDLVKLTGAGWVFAGNAHAVGGAEYISSTLNDIAELRYFGYGFRYWARKANNLGIVEIFYSPDGGAASFASLGNVDLYAAADADAAPLHTLDAVPLGEHRIKVRITHTKNGASTGYAGIVDAFEVMR